MPDQMILLSEIQNIKENQFRQYLLVALGKVYLKKSRETLSFKIYLFNFLITLSPLLEEQQRN